MEYLTIIPSVNDLSDGKECDLLVKDLNPGRRKYETRFVRAKVASSLAKLPDSDVLWIRNYLGYLHPKPWAIKITKELGEYPQYRTPKTLE